MQNPADGPEGLIGSQSGAQDAPARPQAGVASALADASVRGLNRTASLTSLSSAAASFAELRQPAAPRLNPLATPEGKSRSPRLHKASRYGPSQVVPAPPEESQHPYSSRSLLTAQQGQQSAQLTPSLARSVFARVAVIGNRRVLPEQQQQRAAASAAGQEELEAALLEASMFAVPEQLQPEALDCTESQTAAARRGMAAATGSELGEGPSDATLTCRGSRWVSCHALHWCWAPLRQCAMP